MSLDKWILFVQYRTVLNFSIKYRRLKKLAHNFLSDKICAQPDIKFRYDFYVWSNVPLLTKSRLLQCIITSILCTGTIMYCTLLVLVQLFSTILYGIVTYVHFIQDQINTRGHFLTMTGSWVRKAYCLKLWKTINSIITLNQKDEKRNSIKMIYFIALTNLVFLT